MAGRVRAVQIADGDHNGLAQWRWRLERRWHWWGQWRPGWWWRCGSQPGQVTRRRCWHGGASSMWTAWKSWTPLATSSAAPSQAGSGGGKGGKGGKRARSPTHHHPLDLGRPAPSPDEGMWQTSFGM